MENIDKEAYLAVMDQDAQALLAAARRGLSAAVPSCPGWTVAHIVSHVGRAYRWLAALVGERTQMPRGPHPDDYGCDPAAPDLLPWFAQSLADFRSVLTDVNLDEPLWTWSADQRAGFWLRLMAHETAIHRYDAQLAHHCAEPVQADLTRASIDFTFDHWLPACRPLSLLPARGESYQFEQTDGQSVWRLQIEPHTIAVARTPGPASVVLRGAASDLLLALWRRTAVDRLEVRGDAGLIDRYFELVPPC